AELDGIHRLCVIRNILADIADENKDVFVFGIDVMMLPLPPLGFVQHLGKNQSSADRIQYFTAIQNLIGRRQSGDVSIDEKLSRPPLSHNSRSKLIAPSGHCGHDDLRIFFLKQWRTPAKLAFALIEIEQELTLALGALNCSLPIRLPIHLGISGAGIGSRAANEPQQ